MSIEVAFFVWLIFLAVVCLVVEWWQKRRNIRVNSLRDELGIVSKFHDKPIPFNKNSK